MKTKRITIRQAKPGMLVAEDLYNTSNQLIISNGIALTDKIITRLKFYSINEFNIFLENKTQQVKPVKKHISQQQTLKESAEFKQFQDTFINNVQNFKGELNKLTAGDTPVDATALLSHTNEILSNSRNGIHVFDMLHCMREYDDITFVHSVNVSLLSNVFGHWLKLPEKDIEVLTLAALLHDTGKLTLPAELINKQEKLTLSDYVTIKTHTIQGYNILKGKNLDPRVIDVALMHHERCDGSGYPYKLKGDEISPFAKIISIVDVYDAMTSSRVYRPALSPFEAIKVFESEGLQKYDPHFIMTFLEEIIQAYVGNRVRLSNQMEGEIILINKHSLSKPVVQVGSEFIDLSKERNITIDAIL